MIVETFVHRSTILRDASLTLLGNSTRPRDLRGKDTLSPYGTRLRVRDDYDKRAILDRENLDSFQEEEGRGRRFDRSFGKLGRVREF